MLSEKPWKPEAVLRLGFGVFVCLCLGALLAELARHLLALPEQPPLVRILVLAGFNGAALVLTGRFLREHRMGWADAFGWRNHPGAAVVRGITLTCLFLPLQVLLLGAIVKIMVHLGLQPEAQTTVQLLRGLRGWPVQALFALVTMVLAPVTEEVVFRGILYPAVKRLGYPRSAWWGTSLLFALVHFNPPSFLPLLLLALLLTWLYERTDNLLAPIAAHSLFNALNFAMLQFADKLPHS